MRPSAKDKTHFQSIGYRELRIWQQWQKAQDEDWGPSSSSPKAQGGPLFSQLAPALSIRHILKNSVLKNNFLPLPAWYKGFNKMLLTSDTKDHVLHPGQLEREQKVVPAREKRNFWEVFRVMSAFLCFSFYPKSQIKNKPEWDDPLMEKTYSSLFLKPLLTLSCVGFLQQVAGRGRHHWGLVNVWIRTWETNSPVVHIG